MDKERIKGAAQNLKGKIKTAFGRATGNKKLEVEGQADKAIGSAREGVGEAKDAVRDAVKERTK